MGDRASLDLVGRQDELIDAIAATGKPIIALLFNGRPISIRNLSEKAQAIFECWYLGQETGPAVAEVLFGDFNPGGKLPITIPRSVGHLPAYYNYKPAARRGYLFDDVSPLYAFGFGLSYTTFKFGTPKLTKAVIRKNESTTVRVDVTNTGQVQGDEVVQMYIRDKVSSVTRPVKELKGFGRITLEARADGDGDIRYHAGASRLLEYRYEICCGARRFRDHGREFVQRSGSSKSTAARSIAETTIGAINGRHAEGESGGNYRRGKRSGTSARH